MDVIYTLVKNIIGTNYEDIPSEAVEAAKKSIMDTLGVSLGGSSREGIGELVDILSDWGGKEESTVWVYGCKLPCICAAQANATMAHALDYDDAYHEATVHPGAVAVPTAFAIAERLGRIDGKKLITAVVLAVDLTTRLCLATTVSVHSRGWHYTTLHGNFNATTVAGKLLELDEETFVNAFGLSYHQAGGTLQALRDGALAKRAGPGFAARNGITAAIMAQKGITGAKNVLQGRDGLFNTYHRGDYNPEVLTANLGEKFGITNLSFKPHPCCGANHACIDATLALVHEQNIKAEDVDNITVYLDKDTMELLCEPLDTKRNPCSAVDTQFSIPWVVASAIVHGKIGLDDFTSQAIKDGTVLMLSNKVTPKLLSPRIGVKPTAIVEIKTKKSGGIYSRRVDTPYGRLQNPMSMDDMITKFRDCAFHAAKRISQKNIEELIQMISQLEEVNDVNRVVRKMIAK